MPQQATPQQATLQQATPQQARRTGRLRHGRQTLAIPGPSVMPDRVLAAMATPMPNIYAGELVDISDEVFERLPPLARTTSAESFVVMSNGHGPWQMAICNTMSRGDRVLVCESGHFAVAWGEMAEMAGVEVEILPGSLRAAVDPAALTERLRADTDQQIKAVLCVQTDTGTSVRNDVPALRAAIDAAEHPAMFMVDCIASLGCEPFEMDEWGVDIAVTASQKGLMVPPGLGFLWASPKAMAAYEHSDLHLSYLDWDQRTNVSAHYELYSGTPPISHLYAMREALDIIDEEGGLDAVWERHAILAGAVRAAVDAWSTPGGIECNIVDPSSRSDAVTTVLTGSIDPDRLRDICEDEAGLTLGLGIGAFDGRAFRICHMGHLNPPMLLGALGTIEAALLALDAPMGGSGVAAAAAEIGRHLVV